MLRSLPSRLPELGTASKPIGGRLSMKGTAARAPYASDEETRNRFRSYRQTGDRGIRNRLVEDHRNLAHAVVRGFRRGDMPDEDLLQVALLGLVRAADRYDPDYGPT